MQTKRIIIAGLAALLVAGLFNPGLPGLGAPPWRPNPRPS